MSASSVFRATRKLEEAGLVEVLESGDGRTATEYQLPPRVVNLTTLGGQSDDPGADTEGSRVVNPTTLGGQSDDPGMSDRRPRVVNLTTQGGQSDGPQISESGQSDAPTDPAVSTRVGADADVHARVGWLVGSTNQPTNLPTTDRAHASASDDAAPIDERAVEFMASLNLKRTPQISEQVEIADLFLARIAAGFTIAEIRNSVGEWGDAGDRVRVLIWRLGKMPDRPLRLPVGQQTAPQALPECVECRAPIRGALAVDGLCSTCRQEAYLAAKEYLAAAPVLERAAALRTVDARGLGEMDEWTRVIRGAEVLDELERMSTNDSGDAA